MVYNVISELIIEHIFINFITNPSVYRLLFPRKKVETTFFLHFIKKFSELLTSELLPLVEVGASWEVCAFISHIYLPSSLDSPYPDIFLTYFFFF